MGKTVVLSVVLPVYNCAEFLAQSIQSVLSQSFGDFELIILNDGSKDDSLQIVNSFLDPRINIYSRSENLGLVYSLNEGVRYSKGLYVARMDADDICYPDRFKRQIEFLEKNTRVGVLGGGVRFIDEKGVVIGEKGFSSDIWINRWKCFSSNPLSHPTTVIRKELLDKVGCYQEAAYPAEDFDLWIRCLDAAEISNIEEPILYYRINSLSISNKHQVAQVRMHKSLLKSNLESFLDMEIPRGFVDFYSSYKNFPYVPSSKSTTSYFDILLELKAAFFSNYPITMKARKYITVEVSTILLFLAVNLRKTKFLTSIWLCFRVIFIDFRVVLRHIRSRWV